MGVGRGIREGEGEGAGSMPEVVSPAARRFWSERYDLLVLVIGRRGGGLCIPKVRHQ